MAQKILVVDDQEIIAEETQAILASGMPDADVIAFHHTKDNTDTLKQLVHEEAFAAIVTDNQMRNLNGIGLAKFIRSGGTNKDAPIILQTSDTGMVKLLQAKEAGIDRVINKDTTLNSTEQANPLVNMVVDTIAEREKAGRKLS